MSDLDGIIRACIEAEGPISVARFMQFALQHPTFGYYVTGDPLGHEGDFTTSPEISQLFGEMVGVWCAELWRLMGQPPRFALLEMGPGRGTLMQDALRATARVDGFHAALKLYMMESNATLRAKQLEKLGAFAPHYVESPNDLPPLPLIVIANEFLDAMPIHQYLRTSQGWRERMVGVKEGAFVFMEGDAPLPLPLPEHLPFYETAPQAIALVQEIAAAIAERGGGALFVDYGYTQPSGQDTLQAVSKHAFARDPLARPGQVDLTAHVDFSALRVAAERAGAKVWSVATQGDFLRAMGIELRAVQVKHKASDTQAHEIDLALRRLTDEAQMGTLFKAFALTRRDLHDIPGFS